MTPPPAPPGNPPPAPEGPVPSALAPPSAEPLWQGLDPAVQGVWRLGLLGRGLPLVAGALALDLGPWARLPSPFPFALTLAALVLVAVPALLLPRVWYRRWRYAATEEALFAERGWLTRVRTVVPLGRVQHLDVADGVLERRAGLARLVVHTAGTRSYTVTVPGLPRARAEALRDGMRAFLAEDSL